MNLRLTSMVKIKTYLWNLLPDTCEIAGCCGQGTRGNENKVYAWPELHPDFFILMCDYCHASYMDQDLLYVDGVKDAVILRNGVVADLALARKRLRRLR